MDTTLIDLDVFLERGSLVSFRTTFSHVVCIICVGENQVRLDSSHHQSCSKVLYHQLDISDEKSVESLRDFISKELGGIDLLVNNAGMAFPMSDPTPFKEQARQTIDAWQKMKLYETFKGSWQDSQLVDDACSGVSQIAKAGPRGSRPKCG